MDCERLHFALATQEVTAMDRPLTAQDWRTENFAGLLQGARRGDRKALGRLLDSCRAYLLQIAQMELPDRLHGKIDPTDVVQDTFLEAQTGFGGFDGDTEPALLAWLRGILRHNLTDVARRFHRDKRAVGREFPLDDSANEALQNELLDDESTPSSHARSREQDEAVQRAVEQLPAHYRDVILRHDYHGLSFEEIGPRLGKSPEAARKLWERAIKQLRLLLGAAHDFR